MNEYVTGESGTNSVMLISFFQFSYGRMGRENLSENCVPAFRQFLSDTFGKVKFADVVYLSGGHILLCIESELFYDAISPTN